MLASHHEKLAETAPEASTSTSAAKPAADSTGKEKDKPKREPVTSRDHLETAADLMSDIQVETYSSMDKREKTEL